MAVGTVPIETSQSVCYSLTYLSVRNLEEESEDLASSVLSAGLLVVHDAVGGGQNELAELTRGKQIRSQLVDLIQGHVESGRDDTAFVQTAQQIDDNLAGSVVIDDLDIADVTVLLHSLQKLDDHLGGGTDENL
jgi:hypothetical protein